MTRVGDIDMTSEIRFSSTAKPIPRLIQPLLRCKICKGKKATCYFVTRSMDGFVLFCEPCFEAVNVLYKREIILRVQEGTILEDEVEH